MKRVCTNCNKIVVSNAKFCVHCGIEMVQGPKAGEISQSKSVLTTKRIRLVKRGAKIAFFAICALVIATAISDLISP